MNMNDLKEKFYLPEDVTYLNCAYMAPLLKSVEEAGIKAIRKRRNPLAYSVDDFFDDTQQIRRIFSELINASSERIVLIPSVSYGMANVARMPRISTTMRTSTSVKARRDFWYP